MNKHLLKYFAFCVIALVFTSCNDSESELLKTKVFFENNEQIIEIESQVDMVHDLQARLSSKHSSVVQVSYAIADAKIVEEYNTRNGTNYDVFNSSDVELNNESVIISEGNIYSEISTLKLSNLDKIKEGTHFLLPIHIKTSSIAAVDGMDIIYFIIKKPVRILNVGKFTGWSGCSVKVPLTPGKPLTSLTYESLIYINYLNSNNTIMGCEGVLILRIGDPALPGGARDLIQIAGNKQFHATQKFETKKWYHVAFTYDQPSGKAIIYINGEKAAESDWDTPSFDLSTSAGGFFIGKIDGFMWGERPFDGYMSEVRLWTTARSQNQIKQNMLDVDPKADGLAAYYKFNGLDQYQDGSTWYIKDASEHDMNGLVNRGYSAINITTLDEPVVIK